MPTATVPAETTRRLPPQLRLAAIGIGTTIHLHCDLTYASIRTEFRTPFVDLAVVSQSHPAHLEDRVRLQIPDQLPMQAACPTIVLPWERRIQSSGHHTLIAWKNTREAGRAVRDAIPFLGQVDDVYLLGVALQRLVANAGRRVLLSHWGGNPADLSPSNLQAVVSAAAFFLPRGVGRKLRDQLRRPAPAKRGTKRAPRG